TVRGKSNRIDAGLVRQFENALLSCRYFIQCDSIHVDRTDCSRFSIRRKRQGPQGDCGSYFQHFQAGGHVPNTEGLILADRCHTCATREKTNLMNHVVMFGKRPQLPACRDIPKEYLAFFAARHQVFAIRSESNRDCTTIMPKEESKLFSGG